MANPTPGRLEYKEVFPNPGPGGNTPRPLRDSRGEQFPHVGGGLRAHVLLCHNYYDLMAFTTPGESPLRYRQNNRKVSHGHENVVAIKEPTPQPEYAVKLDVVPYGGNAEPSRLALAGAKGRGPHAAEVRAKLAY